MVTDADKTVEVSITDPLLKQQQEYVEQMRDNMLQCETNSNIARVALNNITVLRVYHQISSIIRYLDLMDKLEEKLYKSIEHQVDTMNEESSNTWMTLLNIQEKLQKNMIESTKLLQPYMNISEFAQLQVEESKDTIPTLSFDAATRDELRTVSTNVLKTLNAKKVG